MDKSRRDFLENVGKATVITTVGGAAFFRAESAQARTIASGGDPEVVKKRIENQLREPSQYKLHILRTADGMPDISLERQRWLGVTLWADGVTPQMDAVNAPLSEMMGEVTRFIKTGFGNKTEVAPELLPFPIITDGSISDFRTLDKVIPLLEQQLKEKMEDKNLLERCLARINTAKSFTYKPSSDEFLNIIVFNIGNTFRINDSSANIGLVHITPSLTVDTIIRWREHRLDNLTAHEGLHGIGTPDQYPFPSGQENEWFDPDQFNILGSNMWNLPLEQMRIGQRVRQFMENKGTRILLPNVSVSRRDFLSGKVKQ